MPASLCSSSVVSAVGRFVFIVAIVSMVATSAWAADASRSRPNFVIFLADDVSWDDIGAYGNPHIKTPNLDRLAKQGMRFDHAFLTCSSCSPTRCSIMTGRYPHSTGAMNLHEPLPANQLMFTTPLRKAGYFTGAAGKWHLGPDAKKQMDRVMPRAGASGAENWLELLRERPKDKPFLLWYASRDAHRPYKPGAIEKPHTADDVRVPPYLPDLPEVRRDLAMYYDEISRLDKNIGLVLDELDRQGVADNTFVLFLADNGRPFQRCKTTVHDSGVRTPFIVRWPGHVTPKTVTKSIVSVIDIAPTILAIAGLDTQPSFQGKSFLPILKNPTAEIRQYAFSEHNWHVFKAFERSVRDKRYRYIYNALPELAAKFNDPGITTTVMNELCEQGKLTEAQLQGHSAPGPLEMLYDCEADPHNMKNLIDDPRYMMVKFKMRQLLAQWRQQTNDKMPEKLKEDRKGVSREPYIRLNKTPKRAPGGRTENCCQCHGMSGSDE